MIHIRFEGRSLDLLQNYQMPPWEGGWGERSVIEARIV